MIDLQQLCRACTVFYSNVMYHVFLTTNRLTLVTYVNSIRTAHYMVALLARHV